MMRFFLIPYEFVLLNWAAMRALFCFLSRRGLSSLWIDDGELGNRRGARSH